MIATRGMGQSCGLATFGMGQFVTVVVILPNRIFVTAVAVAPELQADIEQPVMIAILLYPLLTAVWIMPAVIAETLEFEMQAETQQPVASGQALQPSISAIVIQPNTEGSGS